MIKKLFKHYRASYSGLSKPIWLLSLILFVNRSGSMVIFFLSLYLRKHLDFTIAETGKMMSVYGMGALVGSYLGGWLSDKIGNSKVQYYSLFSSGILYIIVSLMNSALSVAIALFALAVSSEGFRPANIAAFATFSKPEVRTRAFGLQRLAVNAGIAIGPAIGGFLARVDYVYLFWIDGVTCILAGIFHYFYIHNKFKPVTSEESKIKSQYKGPFQDKIFLIILIFTFMMGIVFMQMLTTWSIYLKSVYGILEDKIGILLTINTIIIILIEIPVIHSLEKAKILRIIALGSFLLCLGFGLLPFGVTYAFLIITVIIWTVGEILAFPLLSGFISKRASEAALGKYMGMYSFSFSLAFALAPAIGSWIYDNIGGDVLWYSIGIMGVFTALGFLLVEKFLEKENY